MPAAVDTKTKKEPQTVPGLPNPATGTAEDRVERASGTSGGSKQGPTVDESTEPPMTLGPLPSMGISDAIYLADKTEANQCLLTITGALTQVRLHILGDRIAIVTEDPGTILDPNEEADEENADGTPAPAAEQPAADKGAAADKTGADGANKPAVADPTAVEEKRTPLELEHLAGRWFTPDELINVLRASGVNLFPRDDSCTRVESLPKVSNILSLSHVEDLHRLEVFDNDCLRCILRCSRRDRVPCSTLRQRRSLGVLPSVLLPRRLHWFGYVSRRAPGELIREAISPTPPPNW